MGGRGRLRKRVFWQQSSDAIAHSHRGRAANWGRGMKRAHRESGCLSAGCAVLFCELPGHCRLLLGPLGDLESWLGYSLPREPPLIRLLFSQCDGA